MASGETSAVLESWAGLVARQAGRFGERRAYLFLQDGEQEGAELSYGRLELRARAIGAALQQAGLAGERALLLYPPGLEFVEAFFGCLFAGVVAVPVYPPSSERGLPRLRTIAVDARAAAVLTSAAALPRLAGLGMRCLATDVFPDELAGSWNDPGLSPDTLAFLQYTSGSTADPKGVEVSHGNLLHNEAMIQQAFGQSEASVVVGWLPVYHDMGLIGNVLQPLYAGGTCVLMSPVAFLQKPLRWLAAISRYGGTTSGGPNFAYDLCVRKVAAEEKAALDLSSWRVAFNGAEPVRAESLECFAAAFAGSGFKKEAFYPCYGLAEATLFVSGGELGGETRVEAGRVSCGRAWAGQRLEVVEPESRRLCAPGEVGEVWVSGPSVARGYWRQPEATAEVFQARLEGDDTPFLRTGDLGFFDGGELFVTGRLKDLIILRGRNLYPQDVELAAERSHPSLRPGCSAAFSVELEGEERLVVVAELARRSQVPPEEVAQAVRQAVAREHEAQVWEVVLCSMGGVPKTSSGKVQRRACRKAYLEGGLPAVGRSALDRAAAESEAPLELGDPVERVRRLASRALRLPFERVAADLPLSAHGLDSLQAAELRHAIETELGVSLPLACLIEGPSPAALVTLLSGDAAESLPPVVAGLPEVEFPLSQGQRALWFLDRLDPESAAYVIAGAGRLAEDVDPAALRRAFAALAERHPLLRSTFQAEAAGPVHRIHPAPPLPLIEEDAGGWSAEELARRLHEDAYRPFDLATSPPWRAVLYRRRGEAPVLLLAIHHVAADLGSLEVMLRELAALYRGDAALPPPELAYSDFVRWQEGWLAGPASQKQWEFWQRELAGELAPLELPTDRARPRVAGFLGRVDALPLAPELTAALGALARARQATLFVPLLAAFQVLLHRWTGQEDLLVGTPTSGRTTADLAGVVGYFVNPVVLRGRVSSQPGAETSFGELLDRARETVLAAFRHQDLPFPLLAQRLQPERDPSRSPVFQVMLMLQRPGRAGEEGLPAFTSGEAGAKIDLGGLEIESVALEQRAQFDWTLFLAEEERGLRAVSLVNRGLFDASTSRRLLEHLRNLVAALAEEAGSPWLRRPVAELPLLGESEHRQLIFEWSGSDSLPPPLEPSGLYQLFERQAERSPGAAALIHERRPISYRDLAARTAWLAGRLRRLGVGPEGVVGVCLERSPEMATAVLAVLRAGGAYLPLDPQYPRERLAAMLADSGARWVLTVRRLATVLPEEGVRVLLLDSAIAGDAGAGEADGPLPAAVLPESTAYVIFTSGSTGRPKGVAVPHCSLVPYVTDLAARWELGEKDRVLQFHSLSFDLSVEEMFPAWACGAAVVLEPAERLAAPAGLAAVVEAAGVTVLELPTAYWHEWVDELARGRQGLPAGLRITTIGGETVSAARLADWRRAAIAGGVSGELFHGYGLTETTVTSTLYRLPGGPAVEAAAGRPLSIGRPIAGNRLYLLDSGLRPVPRGAAGEVYIGGAHLARGYVGRPGLTAERFLPDPWSPQPGARLYRTGDRARFDAYGDLEFLGRVDRQLKVHGFRIEPGEIEAALLRHPAVREAVVLLRQDDAGLVLAAYVGTGDAASGAFTAGALKGYLQEHLPSHMIPGALAVLERLPRTPNGKVDTAALPRSEARLTGLFGEGAAPRGRTEEALAAIWREILVLERVGPEESFFDLGGHSLLLARLQAEIRRRLDKEVSLLDLFQHPTVRSLARHLDPPRRQLETPRPVAALAGAGEPSPAIAILGMAGRFPGASSVAELWRNLCGGVESIVRFSREELLAEGIEPALLDHPQYVPAAGYLADADRFDANFFGFTPREAEVLDPQHRLFLECAWEALEDAGYRPDACPGEVGVYAGCSLNTYLLYLLSDPALAARLFEFQTALLADKDFLPTRVSYLLNLTGPSLGVQSACSTSLAAIHVACRALRAGECTMALAGGSSVGAPLKAGYLYQEGGAFSPDGHCRTFDAAARGIVAGHGVGVVVLKRLDRALADRDPIVAVIRGTAMNNDGSGKIGFTAPSIDGQVRVVAAALADAGVDPETIGYVEAHGTGTRLGDPIEVAALARAFRASASCTLGSIKTNLGHLDSAAGVAGLIKTALVLRHEAIPPSLHFSEPNPEIDFAAGSFRVATELTGWPRGAAPRRAAVTSLGMGGTNVHAILEEAPAVPPASRSPRALQLLLLSARSAAALDTAAARLSTHLAGSPELALADVAYTLQTGRKPFPHRLAVLCRDLPEAAAALADPARCLRNLVAGERAVYFLFPGQGAQYAGMGRGLYESEAGFREALDRCAGLLAPALGQDLRELLYGGSPAELTATALAQPVLFSVEYALATWLREWGIEPRGLLGHSLGEYVAACLAGVLPLAGALELVALRGRLMQALPAGAMLAVPLAEAALQPLLGTELAVAAVNAPDLCVVSGPPEAVAALASGLEARGIAVRPLHTSHAFHSAMMDPILGEFEAKVRSLELQPPEIPYLSNLTGDWIRPEEATDPRYWVRHLRQTVRFGAGLRRLLEDPAAVLLEVGPGGQLGAMASRQGLPGPPPPALPILRHAREEGDDPLLSTLARLWLLGGEVDWTAYQAREPRRRVSLPTYPFEGRGYWLTPRSTVARGEAVLREEVPDAVLGSAYPRPVLGTPFVVPEGETERRIAAVWEELLGIAPIGRHDSFVELGGHSLLATQMLSRLRDHFGAELPIADFFRDPTVAGSATALVRAVEAGIGADDMAAMVAEIRGLSPEEIQQLLAVEREVSS